MYQNAGNTPGGRRVLGIILIIAMVVMAWLILRNNDVFGEDKNWEAFKNRWYVPLTPIVDSLNKLGKTQWEDTVKGYTITTCKEVVDSVWVCPKHGVIKHHVVQLNKPEGCIKLVATYQYESNLGYFWGRPLCLKCWRENLPIEQVFANQVYYVATEDSNNIFYTSTKKPLDWIPIIAPIDTLDEKRRFKDGYCPICGTKGEAFDNISRIVKRLHFIFGDWCEIPNEFVYIDRMGIHPYRNIIHYRQQYFCPRCGTVFVGLKELEKMVEY